jgi:hypothetical protein
VSSPGDELLGQVRAAAVEMLAALAHPDVEQILVGLGGAPDAWKGHALDGQLLDREPGRSVMVTLPPAVGRRGRERSVDIVVELYFDNGPFVIVNATSFSWGITIGGSGGSPLPPPVPQDLVFTAVSTADATPQLKAACESGSPLRRVTLSVTDPATATGLRWTFDTAFVSSFQTGGDTSGTMSVDSVAVNFLTSAVTPI